MTVNTSANIRNMVLNELAAKYEDNILVHSITLYSRGVLVTFRHSFTSHAASKPRTVHEDRCAYLEFGSIEEDNDTLFRKWDNIC